jgi:hypothetical protein
MNSIFSAKLRPFNPRELAFCHLPEWTDREQEWIYELPRMEVRVIEIKPDSKMASGWAVKAESKYYTCDFIDAGWFSRTDGRNSAPPVVREVKPTVMGQLMKEAGLGDRRKTDVKRKTGR